MEWVIGRMSAITLNVPTFLPFPLAIIAEHDTIGYGTSLGTFEWSAAPHVSPHSFLCTPSLINASRKYLGAV